MSLLSTAIYAASITPWNDWAWIAGAGTLPCLFARLAPRNKQRETAPGSWIAATHGRQI
ncbi:hypothetical protein [Brucella cytisi]|uniref:hypothetical protein n=1 Tax=Brucella cytisi TaxID=407152 RepID=UPI00197D95F0